MAMGSLGQCGRTRPAHARLALRQVIDTNVLFIATGAYTAVFLLVVELFYNSPLPERSTYSYLNRHSPLPSLDLLYHFSS